MHSLWWLPHYAIDCFRLSGRPSCFCYFADFKTEYLLKKQTQYNRSTESMPSLRDKLLLHGLFSFLSSSVPIVFLSIRMFAVRCNFLMYRCILPTLLVLFPQIVFVCFSSSSVPTPLTFLLRVFQIELFYHIVYFFYRLMEQCFSYL